MSQDKMAFHAERSELGFVSKKDIGLSEALLNWTGWSVGDPLLTIHMKGVGGDILIIQKNEAPLPEPTSEPVVRKKRNRAPKTSEIVMNPLGQGAPEISAP